MPGGMFFFGVTRAGCVYLVFVLLVSLAAVRAGSNALYALLAVTLSAIIVSGMISRNTLKQLALTIQTPDRVFAGKTVTTRVSLTNTKRLFPSLAIFVEEMKPDFYRKSKDPLVNQSVPNAQEKKRRPPAFFPILRAGETRSERLEQTFPRRGRRRQTLQVATRFPFGFFQQRDPLPSQELLVYPEIGEIPEFLQTDVMTGRRESRQRGSGENFYSIREYQEGESARAIDWKATAKARKLMAREYAREDEFRCLLILDTHTVSEKNSPEDFEENDRSYELFEKAVSLAAGLAAHFVKNGAWLEFFTPEVHIPGDSGERHLYLILEALAVTRRQSETELFRFDGNAAAAPNTETGGHDTKFQKLKKKPAADLQKLISDQMFSIILTPRAEERFPSKIRRFARIIPFEALSDKRNERSMYGI